MEKQRKIKAMAVMALFLCILGVTIAFAALSGTLKINGSGKMDTAKWDIRFKNISSVVLKGKAKENEVATISEDGAEINNISINLSQPGDEASYQVDLANDGDINAEISNFNIPELSEEQQKRLEFKVIYKDDGKEVASGDVITGETTEKLMIIIRYKDITDENDLNKEDENIALSYKINYIQTDKESLEHNGDVEQGYTPTIEKSLLKELDVSKTENDSVKAYFYNDDTITIEGKGEISSDISDSLVFENTETLDLYKDMITWMGYDASNINSFDDIMNMMGEMSEEEQESLQEKSQVFLIKKGLEKYGYENLDSITDMNTLMSYAMSNNLLDEEGNPSEELMPVLAYVDELGNKLGNSTYKAKEITLSEGVTNVPSGIYSYNEDIENVELPSTITKIEDNAFANCTGLTEIVLPNTVTEIGNNAFENCTNLETVSIGNISDVQGVALTNISNENAGNITSIGSNAFSNCVSLKNINNLIKNVTIINENTFYNCRSLTSITIPNSVISIGNHAFNGCTSLTNLAISNSVTSIGNYAFGYCTGLTNLTIPNSVTSIGQEAFSGCTSLTSISIPGMLYIDNYVFYDANIEEVNITGSGAMVNYQNSPWYFHLDSIKTVIIKSGITSIGSNAFENCTGLTNLTIPNSVTSIGQEAFSGCTGLTSITIPNSVTSIGAYAYRDCTGLTNLTIPESVISIGDYAFLNCIGLTKISIPGTVVTGEDPFANVQNIKEVNITGSGAMVNYDNSSNTEKTPWYNSRNNVEKITISNDITSIGEETFRDCIALTSLIIPDSVISIGDFAFDNCTGLTSITIPNSVTSIGAYAYRDCTGLTNLTIPESVISIGDYAFDSCTGLTSITIPNSVASTGHNIFEDWTSSQTINIDNTSSYVSDNWDSGWFYFNAATINYLRD
ncbi:MAG: leucine-rich repeat domain-containing protein [Bacilli bacterium]|nr:leucine-rich repeat domain-containing protein [Bacilli bacterium]